jgi:tetrathionate reductase subunit B
MTRYAMTIDTARCNGCYNCQIACKDEHVGNEFPPIATSQPTFGHFWMRMEEKEAKFSSSHIKVFYIPIPCQHCGNAACMNAAKNGAVYRRPDGIVIIDPVKAVGQKQIVDACPYRAIFWNEEKRLPQKCTFCAHLLDDGWTEPRCVQTCPTQCFHFGDLDDPESSVAKAVKGEVLRPELDSNPLVHYLELPNVHVSGTIFYADTDECAKNVDVVLKDALGKAVICRTDYFGDFDFAHVAAGKYTLLCRVGGYAEYTCDLDVASEIVPVGDVCLRKAK